MSILRCPFLTFTTGVSTLIYFIYLKAKYLGKSAIKA